MSNKYFIENPNADKPTYTVSIDVANANQKRVVNADVGDIARIYDPKYQIASNQTIVERHFDPDLNMNKSLKAGKLQQTIFRYLDKRIQEGNQKTNAVKSQTADTIIGVQNDMEDSDSKLKKQIDASKQKGIDRINEVKTTVTNTRNDMTNLMNSGGNSKIRWIPTLAEATQMEITTPYGYWLLDDHGAGFHSNDGTVMTGLSADGHVYADSITGNTLTGTTINGGNINGGIINGAQFVAGSIKTKSHAQFLNSAGQVSTSIASYGISTPALTVDGDIDRAIHANIQYLHVSGNISGNASGLYLQGPVYVDGRKI